MSRQSLYLMKEAQIPEDVPALFEMMCADDQFLFSTRLSFSSDASFQNWLLYQLKSGYRDIYMIYSHSNKLLGYVHSYDFSQEDATAHITVYIREGCRGIAGAFAGLWYADYLFSSYHIRRIYADVYDYNLTSLQNCRSAGFEEEGVLKDYRYFNGTFHDLHCLVMTRESFYQRYGKMTEKWRE